MIVASSQQAAINIRVKSICNRRTLNGKMITNNLSSVITTTKQVIFFFFFLLVYSYYTVSGVFAVYSRVDYVFPGKAQHIIIIE